MLSSHLFLCLPCLLPPFTVPYKMVLARPDERETWRYHCSLCLFTIYLLTDFRSIFTQQRNFLASNSSSSGRRHVDSLSISEEPEKTRSLRNTHFCYTWRTFSWRHRQTPRHKTSAPTTVFSRLLIVVLLACFCLFCIFLFVSLFVFCLFFKSNPDHKSTNKRTKNLCLLFCFVWFVLFVLFRLVFNI